MSELEPTYEELVGPEAVADEDLDADAKLRAHDLFTRLQGTFSEPGYITLEEVRDATGFDSNRSADAMAISLYRSRGKALWGFEFKVSRSDWLHELKQPEKAESILRYCNYWALVVPDKNIVKTGELPETWGLYVAQKNRLKCVVPCPKLDPLPLSVTMLTALAYAIDQKHKRSNKADLDKARNEGYQQGLKSTSHQWYEDQYNKQKDIIETFQKSSGIDIRYGHKDVGQLGEIVRAIVGGEKNLENILRELRYSLRSLDRMKEQLEAQATEIEARLPKKEQESE